MSAGVPGLSHPSVLKASATGEHPSPYACPDRARPGVPEQAAGGPPRPGSVPLHSYTSLSPCPSGGYGCASRPLAQGLQAGQLPRPSRQALGSTSVTPPAAALLQTPISWSAPAGRRGEAPKYLLPSILRLSRMWYLQGE